MTIAALAARNTPTGDYQDACGWFFSRLALFFSRQAGMHPEIAAHPKW